MSYNLTVSIEPTGAGGIIPSPSGSYVSPGVVSFPENTSVKLTVQSFIPGVYFDHWEGALSGSANPAYITMNSNKSVKAVFKNVPGTETVNLSTNVVGSGSIAPSSGILNKGDEVILVASPGSGYKFSNWFGDIDGGSQVSGMPDHFRVVMDKDRSIGAVFEVKPVIGDAEFRGLYCTYSKV